jgi:hypothetical protein
MPGRHAAGLLISPSLTLDMQPSSPTLAKTALTVIKLLRACPEV